MFSFRLNIFSSRRSRCWFLPPFSLSPSLTHLFSNVCLKILNIHIIMLRRLDALSKNKEFKYVRYMFSLLAWLSPFSLHFSPHFYLIKKWFSFCYQICVHAQICMCVWHTQSKKTFCRVPSDQTPGGKCLYHPSAASPEA